MKKKDLRRSFLQIHFRPEGGKRVMFQVTLEKKEDGNLNPGYVLENQYNSANEEGACAGTLHMPRDAALESVL